MSVELFCCDSEFSKMSEHSESQDTNSTSLVEDSINISFQDLNYTVRHGILRKERKTILDNICGSFNGGELSVIMGQSGAGKSTLMDILAGYTKPTSGHILVNGQIRNEQKFRRRSCYIFQDDKIHEMLTIEESLKVAADLRLGDHVSKEKKLNRVKEIINSLGLVEARHTRAGKLSGGQKKRLAIGLELVSDPPVMFIDEPTSGLDSSISKQIVYLLYLLARQGRTVIVTMHQPSAGLLEMVDRLYFVAAGQCAYLGSVSQLLPCMEQIKLTCPINSNPVDFLIEISTEKEKQLVESSENGRSDKWIRYITPETDSNIIVKPNLACQEVRLTMLPSPKDNPNRKLLLSIKSTYPTSFWKQFISLTRRSLITLTRDKSFTVTIILIHCFMALFLGALMPGIGNKADKMHEIFSFLFFSQMFLMFTAFSSVSIRYPEEIPIVRREHFNQWYSTGAYYLSTLVSTLPTQAICTLSYCCIAYFITGQPAETFRFVSFCLVLLMVAWVALCIGLLNGSLFTVKSGTIFGPLLLMPFTIFSGFFLTIKDAPSFVRWIFHVSFLKHGTVGLVTSVLGWNRTKLECNGDYCHYKIPNQFLISVNMDNEDFNIAIIALFTIGLVVVISTFLILKIRLKIR